MFLLYTWSAIYRCYVKDDGCQRLLLPYSLSLLFRLLS